MKTTITINLLYSLLLHYNELFNILFRIIYIYMYYFVIH